MLDQEFAYYVEHHDDFVQKYDGKVIVLKGTEVLSVFDNISDAYWWAVEQELLGQVMIQPVAPGEDNYTLTVHSQLLFV